MCDSVDFISPQSNYGNLFAPIQAPKLKAISRKAIQHFLAEREQYEIAVEAQSGINPISWAGCFEAFFLRSLVRERVFGANYTEVSDLTDEIIKTRLTELASTYDASYICFLR